MPYDAPPELASLSLIEIAEAVQARRLPPVTEWDPPETIDSKMRIAADGAWFHEEAPIRRKAMVRAFASLLIRQPDGTYALMTPQCRQSIVVEDAAFVAVDLAVRTGEADGEALAFRLNTDEFVIAGPDHPLRATGDAERPAIYLAVRNGCEARLDRSTWLQLAEHALARSDGECLMVTSRGARFSLAPA